MHCITEHYCMVSLLLLILGCEDLRDTAGLQWLDCNDDRYSQEQCINDLECFCVDVITGNRMDYMSYRRGDNHSCDGK